eukprot:5038541-Prymnesium_polylepis.1
MWVARRLRVARQRGLTLGQPMQDGLSIADHAGHRHSSRVVGVGSLEAAGRVVNGDTRGHRLF